jgi:hypothetical protein
MAMVYSPSASTHYAKYTIKREDNTAAMEAICGLAKTAIEYSGNLRIISVVHSA